MQKRKVLAWALYDFGNSAFVTTIMVALFPIFFKSFFENSLTPQESTAYLGFGNAIATFAVMLLAPFLGALSDIRGQKKLPLLFFAVLGALATAALSLSTPESPIFSLSLYILASVGFLAGNIFYDALMTTLGNEEQMDGISLFGYALGYLGGGLFFLCAAILLQFADSFGLSRETALNIVFIATGVWWVLFLLPLLITYKEAPLRKKPKTNVLHSVKKSFKNIIADKNIAYFLLAYMFYIDGVDTIAKMASDFGMSVGIDSSDLIVSLLIIQFVSFPATLATYKLLSRFRPKTVLYALISIYIVVVIGAAFMSSGLHFFILAFCIGLAQGGLQAISRSYYAKLIPQEESGEYFGIYNMFGKFSSIFGPLLVALTATFSDEARYNLLPVIAVFLLGIYFLSRVKR